MKTTQTKSYFLSLIGALFLTILSGCESFVEISSPKIETVSSAVYADDISAVSAIRGIYHEMIRIGFANGSSSSITFLCGLSADELKSNTASLDEFYNNNISPTNGVIRSDLWSAAYKTIYYCNSAIEGIEKSTTLTTSTKNQLAGEARFIRAFSYFYLINLFGEVPLILTTSYADNAVSSKSDSDTVFLKIIQDLNESQLLLSNDYQFAGGERVRVNKWAATAMLARVYLYHQEWAKAETQASAVISNVSLFSLTSDLNSTFLKNSSEAIWQLMPVTPSANTNEGQFFIPASATSIPTYVSLTNSFISGFEISDKRKSNWINTSNVSGTTFYYPYKYKISKTGQPLTEYSMVLRLAEQYLIRAEAKAKQGKLVDAISDINIIRQRAGLNPISSSTPTPSLESVLSNIEQERRSELFAEWGHRWFDLKRSNRATIVLQPNKPNWKETASLYPLPQAELVSNPNLNPQNPGY